MINIVKLPKNDRTVLFSNTASKMGLNPIVVEKDYWVCYTLDYLFHRSKYKNAFIFKGGLIDKIEPHTRLFIKKSD